MTEGLVDTMDIFDIIGPVMVGPSSSHTAGAVRIGYVGQKLLAEPVVKDRSLRLFLVYRKGAWNRSCAGCRIDGLGAGG